MTSTAITPSENRRRWVIAVVAVLVIGVGAAGLMLGGRLRSPAEQALETEPPDLGLLTVPVEVGRLGAGVVERGVWVEVQDDSVGLPGLAGQGRIVTALPKVGATLDPGGVALELEGRPLFVFPGTETLYRDLTGGAIGRDVEAIQKALVAVGLDPGEINGFYGPETAAAVAQLYSRAGYESPQSPVAATELTEATNMVTDSEEALRAAIGERSSSTAANRAAVVSAGRAVDDAVASLTDAKSLADQLIQSAAAETTAAQLAYDQALEDHEAATPEEQDETAQKVADTLARLEDAVATEAQIQTEANESIRQAESALATAHQGLDAAKRNASNSQGLDAAVESAQRALIQAKESMELALLGGLTPFPAAEVTLVPSLPGQVTEVAARTGEMVEGEAIVIARDASLVAVAVVPRDIARRIEQGMHATIRSEGLPDVDGTVSWIAPQVGQGPAEGRYGTEMSVPEGHVAVEVAPAHAGEASTGFPVSVVLDLYTSDDGGLIVPTSAVRTEADGSSWLAVANGDGTTRRVPIEVRAESDGRVSVSGEGLQEGDEVVLGGL